MMKTKLLYIKKYILVLAMLIIAGFAFVAFMPNETVKAAVVEQSGETVNDESGITYKKVKYYYDYENNPWWYDEFYTVIGFDCSKGTTFAIPASFNEIPVNICLSFDIPSGVTEISFSCKSVSNIEVRLSDCKNLTSFTWNWPTNSYSTPTIKLASNKDLSVNLNKYESGTLDMSGCKGNVSLNIGSYNTWSSEASITFPEKLKEITFGSAHTIPNLSGKAYLTKADFSGCTGSLTDNAFKNCTALTSVALPSNLYYIPKYAFYNCKSLKSISLPSTVTQLSPYAFAYSGLKSIKLPANCTSINNHVFYKCTSLTGITLPSNLAYINEAVFAYSGLKSIKLPSSCQYIFENAFYKCTSLRQIVIPKTVTYIYASAFTGRNGFLTIVAPTESYAATFATNNKILTSTSTAYKLEAEMPYTYVGAKRYINLYNFFGTAKFVSSNEKIATVSSSGVITPKKAGNVKITLYLNGKKYKTYSYTVYSRTQANVLKIIYAYYVTPSMTDYQKIVAADKWLVEFVSYDCSKYNGGSYPYERHTAKSAFEKGLAVCDGYSYAFQTIMDHYGITCKVVTNSTHAWNEVKLGSYWYYVDVTWDDPTSYDTNGKMVSKRTVSTQNYLLINSSQIAKDHKGPFHNGTNTKATSKNYNKQINHTGYYGAVINRTTATVNKGKTTTVKVSGTKKKVTFSTSNKSIATVNSKGVITGKKAGTCYIYVKINNTKTFKVKVTVK